MSRLLTQLRVLPHLQKKPSKHLKRTSSRVLQEYVKILNKKEAGNSTDKTNGILYHNQNLLVISEIWYNGSADNPNKLHVFSNTLDISI